MNRRVAIASLLASAGAAFAPRIARGQTNFPERPIRIIVPVAPGGGVDTFARLIAAKISSARKADFVVENRTGGNGTVGGLDVQRSAPDGYTVLFHASTHNVARLVMRDVPYDPLTGFTPIARTRIRTSSGPSGADGSSTRRSGSSAEGEVAAFT